MNSENIEKNDETVEDETLVFSKETQLFFRNNVTDRINFYDSNYVSSYVIRTWVLKWGMTDFDQPYSSKKINFTPEQKVLLYCHFNLRQHLFAQICVFKQIQKNVNLLTGNISFLDVGCGTMAGAIAFFEFLNLNLKKSVFRYTGFDISNCMIQKSEEFKKSLVDNIAFKYGKAFEAGSVFDFYTPSQDNFNKVEFNTNLIVINFSFLFANIGVDTINTWAEIVNKIREKYPEKLLLVINQNTVNDNSSFDIFKKNLKNFADLINGNHKIKFKNWTDGDIKESSFRFDVLISTNYNK